MEVVDFWDGAGRIRSLSSGAVSDPPVEKTPSGNRSF